MVNSFLLGVRYVCRNRSPAVPGQSAGVPGGRLGLRTADSPTCTLRLSWRRSCRPNPVGRRSTPPALPPGTPTPTGS